MKIGIIGAGALGLYYGARLQKSGQQVSFLLRRDYATIHEHGLQVYSVDGDFHLPSVRAFKDPAEMGTVDLALIGLKTFSNPHLINLVRPLVGPETVILTLQNGLGNEDLLASAFPPEQILGGVAFLCSNRGQPGHVHHLGEGRIRLGEYSGGFSTRIQELENMFQVAEIPCEAVADLKKIRWEKLVWNIPFNGLCALTGKHVTDLLNHRPSRDLVTQIMTEVIAGANAQDLSEEIHNEDFIERMVKATEGMNGYQPSMMLDRLAGRPLELDSIYTVPLALARKAGVAMPLTEMLYGLLDLGEDKG